MLNLSKIKRRNLMTEETNLKKIVYHYEYKSVKI